MGVCCFGRGQLISCPMRCSTGVGTGTLCQVCPLHKRWKDVPLFGVRALHVCQAPKSQSLLLVASFLQSIGRSGCTTSSQVLLCWWGRREVTSPTSSTSHARGTIPRRPSHGCPKPSWLLAQLNVAEVSENAKLSKSSETHQNWCPAPARANPSLGQRAQGSGMPPAHGAPLASAGHEFISRFICKTAFP